MTTDPRESHQDSERPDEGQDDGGTVSETAANPTPPDTDTTTSEDVHDMPQSPTRPDVAEQDGAPD
ncbi:MULTISPECIES: hypothetical protein [Aeromicrobium]|uniref:Uncharacterized protein n=1 Tax=Aeromicrobium phoceense TaxID=2754045 RepID=A0A838XGG0_9ACTN|nr:MULTISPECIES: hypothetical protein [Aeromicrobium]MBA4609625.1 hypothetical protein [Aeromicrobium phoceense]